MSNLRLASRYAKSLVDLAVEQQQLDAVYADIKVLQSICQTNSDFVAMLKSPIISSDKKEKIVIAVTSDKIGKLTAAFLTLLINKSREYSLPEIVKAFVDQYNKINDIHPVKLTTAVPVSDQVKNAILDKIRSTTSMQKIELETVVKDELIGGFTLEVGDSFVDASILRDLNDVKKQFLNNDFIQSMR
ncbi:MAG: synthase subunit delta [Bacteroidota bacterium]|jgi:F-type H+-transporting ATPase subunit delta